MAAPSDPRPEPAPGPRAGSGRHARSLFLLIISLVLLFPFLGRQGLSDPGESSQAESVREMRERGEHLIPHLSGEPAVERSALTHWILAASFRLLGESETAARLPSALAALGLLAAVWRLGALVHSNARSGWLAALILASSLQFALMGRSADPDMMFTLFLTTGILCLLEALFRRRSWRWAAAGAACLGISVLIQGTAGLLVIAAVAAFCPLAAGGWPRLRELRPLACTGIFLAVVLPWYVAVALRRPDLAVRWLSPGGHATPALSQPDLAPAPPLYFALTLLVGFLPWSLFLPGALARAVASRREEEARSSPRLLPAVWLLATITLFTLAARWLAVSALPALPAAALLTAGPLSGWLERPGAGRRLQGMGAVLLLVILTGGMVFFSTTRDTLGAVPASFKAALLPICFAALLGSLFTLSSLLLQRPKLAFLLLIGGTVILNFALLGFGFPALEPWRSSRAAAQVVQPMIQGEDRLVSFRHHPPGFGYYLRRIPERVDREMDLQRILALPGRVFCLMGRDSFEQLKTRRPSPPLYLLSQSGALVVVTNRSPAHSPP